MQNVHIVEYKPEYYHEVIKIFNDAHQSYKGALDAIKIGLENPKIWGIFGVAFSYGLYYSWYHAFQYFGFALVLQVIGVIDIYFSYSRY